MWLTMWLWLLLAWYCSGVRSLSKRNTLSHPNGQIYDCDSFNSLDISGSYLEIAARNPFPGSIASSSSSDNSSTYSTCHFTTCSTLAGEFIWCPLERIAVSVAGREDVGCSVPLPSGSGEVIDTYMPCYDDMSNRTALWCFPAFCSVMDETERENGGQVGVKTISVARILSTSITEPTTITAGTLAEITTTETLTSTITPTSTVTLSPNSGTVVLTTTNFFPLTTSVQTIVSTFRDTITTTMTAYLASLNTTGLAAQIYGSVYDITSYASVDVEFLSTNVRTTQAYVTVTGEAVVDNIVPDLQGVVMSVVVEQVGTTLISTSTVYTTLPSVIRTITAVLSASPTSSADETSPSQAQQSSISHHSNGGLSGGAIAGIVIGCLAAVVILLLLAFCMFRRHRRSTVQEEQEEGEIDSEKPPDDDDMQEAFARTATVTRLHRTSAAIPVLIINPSSPVTSASRRSSPQSITVPITLAADHDEYPSREYPASSTYTEFLDIDLRRNSLLSDNIKRELDQHGNVSHHEKESYADIDGKDMKEKEGEEEDDPFGDKHSIEILHDTNTHSFAQHGDVAQGDGSQAVSSRASTAMEFYDARP